MKPPPFDHARAESVEEAVSLLARREGGAKLLAGGQSLVPMLNFRLVHPSLLVDVNCIPGLAGIEEGDGALRIGALARHRQLEVSAAVAERFPVLRAAVRHVAHLAVRNRGTLGGSLAHADPAAELPMMALLLDATIEIAGPAGTRRLAASEFFRSALATDLGEAEMLTRVELPFLPPGTGWGFEEVARRAGDFALAAAAATLTLGADGKVAEARLAVMGAHDTPLRIAAAEALLSGETLDRDAMEAAAQAAREAVEPYDDLHASAGFRRHLVVVLARRALESAVRGVREGAGREEPGRDEAGWESGRVRGGRERGSVVGGAEGRGVRESGTGGAGGRSVSGRRTIRVTVNGTHFEREAEPRRLLADFLREDLDLTGTHVGCEHGVCGACTVLLDGDSARSCLTLAAQADGAEVETVEGLGTMDALHPLQRAFREHHALQCGFCTPGMLMTALDLLRKHPSPNEAEVRDGLSGNLCRCTGYEHIVRAVRAAAGGLAATPADTAAATGAGGGQGAGPGARPEAEDGSETGTGTGTGAVSERDPGDRMATATDAEPGAGGAAESGATPESAGSRSA